MSAANHRNQRWRIVAISLLLGLAGAGLGGCVTEPSPITGQSRSYGYSWQQEQQLGAEADQQVMQEMGVYDDAALQDYVAAVGKRVLESSDLRDADTPDLYRGTKFTFRVLNSSVVNAFALPGGYVYVTRGLLTHLQNEAQLGVVLGHEIAHVAARHASQQALRSQIGQLGLIAGAILGEQVLGEGGGELASSILDVGGQALQLFMFRYSRDAEREADQLGVRYAGLAGYDTAEAVPFFHSLERISAAEGSALPEWASTHPDPGERAQTVAQLSKAWAPIAGAPERRVGAGEFLSQIEGVVVGDDPREGFEENNVFYHPQLRFQLPVPPGWRLQNQQAVVLMADPAGGAVIGLEIVPGGNPAAAATEFVRQSGIRIINTAEATIHGLPAVMLIGQAATANGPVGVFDAFIGYEGRVYSVRGLTSARGFARYGAVFEGVARGFQPLTDPARLGVQPQRIHVVKADRRAPFREFLAGAELAGLTPEQIAIMNQVSLDDVIEPGRPLKLPQ